MLGEINTSLTWYFSQGWVLLAVFLANIAALVIALVQAHQASEAAKKSATSAEVARHSAEEAWAALSSQVHQVQVQSAASFVRQVIDAISRDDWTIALYRARDLLELVSNLYGSLPEEQAVLKQVGKRLRAAEGGISEKLHDPEYVITNDLHEHLTYASKELSTLVGRQSFRREGGNA